MHAAVAGAGRLRTTPLPARLVLASANAGKQREFAALLAPLGIELILQSQLGIASIEETGRTFEDNAVLKARHAAHASALPALADDSGLEVDALGGRPGVLSARYAGVDATDERNNALLLRELARFPLSGRTARYRCVLALVRTAADAQPLLARGSWEGHIALAPAGAGGFGYDPLFVPEGFRSTAAQLPAEDKNRLSHRGIALRSLVAMLSQSAGGAPP
jgi:XTP/dITP diphosphohydrolase